MSEALFPSSLDASPWPVQWQLHGIGCELSLCGQRLSEYLTEGKLLRARLVVLAAGLGTRPSWDTAVRYATFLELVHAGALCHDDVVDRSCLRRGRPTIACAFGPRTAVLTGLFLMLRALELLADEPVRVRRAVARTLRDVARGQTDELGDLFADDVSPEAYLRRAYGKTGALYELGGRLGALAGGLDAAGVDALSEFAADVGVAFQLTDDVRDLVGGPSLGREAGTDLREGVYTLPLLLTFAGRCAGGDGLRRLLARPGAGGRVGECVALLRGNGALAATLRLAGRRLEDALAALGGFPLSAGRRGMEALARELLESVTLLHETGGEPDGRVGRDDDETSDVVTASASLDVPSFQALAEVVMNRSPERLASLGDSLRDECRGSPPEDGVFDRAAGVGAAILDLASDVRRGAGRSAWAVNATLVGAIDLLVPDLFSALASAPSVVVRSAARGLAGMLRTAAIAAADAGT